MDEMEKKYIFSAIEATQHNFDTTETVLNNIVKHVRKSNRDCRRMLLICLIGFGAATYKINSMQKQIDSLNGDKSSRKYANL